jgi:Fic family protein
MNALEKAEQLKNELDSLRPLDAEAEARIMQKFRLDWNYHSNKLEGNSYTYGETKMLLLYGLTAGGKPIRDHEEISGHNEAIETIIEVIKDQTQLTETFIRHLHKLILVKPEWIEAKTADGQPTKRLIKVGEYKTEPNHVETNTGEIF